MITRNTIYVKQSDVDIHSKRHKESVLFFKINVNNFTESLRAPRSSALIPSMASADSWKQVTHWLSE